uniref:V-set and immunoglobulin domain-containing protein 1 n=1 Tax=Salmo trutta TaxID=8032 RepID=A0A673ZZB4_SALTR
SNVLKTPSRTNSLAYKGPSMPFCAVHGNVESGHLVTLTCHSERGSPTPTYTWIRVDQDKTKTPVMGNTDPTIGSLYFRNISQFEFGEYRCSASNAVGSATCTVELNHGMGNIYSNMSSTANQRWPLPLDLNTSLLSPRNTFLRMSPWRKIMV